MKDLFDIEQLTQFEFGAIVISVLVAGLIFGCLIAWGILNRKGSANVVAAEKIQQEFEEYKEKVDEHFTETSEMFKDVTTQYKKLYDHMAVGAVSLGNADTIAMPRLEMQDSEDNTQVNQTEEVADEQTSIEEESALAENNSDSVDESIAENNDYSVDESIAENSDYSVDESIAENSDNSAEESVAQKIESTSQEPTDNTNKETSKSS